MKLIVGLGNPDKKYQNTRHNIGQIVINKLLEKYRLHLSNYPKLNVHLADSRGAVSAPSSRMLLGITCEYMNNSGIAIRKAADYYKILPNDVMVIHDELDLGVGEWKLQFDRGPAGHNGVKSTIDHLGTQGFWRLRIGVNHPRNTQNPSVPVEDYVLLPFTTDEKVIIDQTIDKIVKDFDTIIAQMGS